MGKVKGQDGEALKERGMKRAATNPNRSWMLELVRDAALQAPDRYTGITIEDAVAVMAGVEWGPWTWEEVNAILGPAAGSWAKRKGDGWKFTGKRRNARQNPANHAREHRVWRLVRPVRVKVRVR